MLGIKQLTIEPAEAEILEICMKGVSYGFFPRLPLFIARCLVTKQSITFGISESDLWMLRAQINPQVSVGRIRGIDLITKLCKLIVEYDEDRLMLPITQLVGESYVYNNENRTEENRDRDNTGENDFSFAGT